MHHKPFVNWIRGGCLLMGLGGFLAVGDKRYRLRQQRKTAAEPAPTGQAPALQPSAARMGG